MGILSDADSSRRGGDKRKVPLELARGQAPLTDTRAWVDPLHGSTAATAAELCCWLARRSPWGRSRVQWSCVKQRSGGRAGGTAADIGTGAGADTGATTGAGARAGGRKGMLVCRRTRRGWRGRREHRGYRRSRPAGTSGGAAGCAVRTGTGSKERRRNRSLGWGGGNASKGAQPLSFLFAFFSFPWVYFSFRDSPPSVLVSSLGTISRDFRYPLLLPTP